MMSTANGGRSKGAVMFAAVADRQEDIAKKLGLKTRSLVSMWRNGERTPRLANRKQLLARYKIPIEAWDQPPAPTEWGEPAAMGQVEVLEGLCRQTRAQLVNDGSMTPLERLKVGSALAKLEDDLRRLKGENLLAEAEVLKHPKWKELKVTILEILTKHPDALRDVVAALERAGDTTR